MGVFRRKPKIDIKEFCKKFYDSQIFRASIGGTNQALVFWDAAFDSVAEADRSFATIDRAIFRREMTALSIELFGLAWMHHLKWDKYTLPEIVFTKHYLEENGHLEIWDTMGTYNEVIGRPEIESVTGKRTRKAWIVRLNKVRTDLFAKWVEAGVEPDCASRVVNRIGSDVSWNRGITMQMLPSSLAARVGWDINLNSEALFRLAAIIYGLYNGAKEAIKSVSLQPSFPISNWGHRQALMVK